MNLNLTIKSAELKFQQILEEFFILHFDEKSLSSHGIDHHRRVWNYAKDLILLPGKGTVKVNPSLPFNLIIASYLHDIGMSVDTGIRHGQHSKELCLRFLRNHNLKETDYQNVLQAIENHDNKEYKRSPGKSDLLTILSVADDLDAYGFTGIFRYSEIYLTRGIKPSEIGYMIIENAATRFNYFESNYGFSDQLFQKHRSRYLKLENFFTNYNKQVQDYQFGDENPSGYCGVIELFSDVINNNIRLAEICSKPEKFSNDQVIIGFFKGLSSELLLEHQVL